MSQDQQISLEKYIKVGVSPEWCEMRRADGKSRNSKDGFFKIPLSIFLLQKRVTLYKNFANKWVIKKKKKKLNSMAVIERLENEWMKIKTWIFPSLS